MKTIIKNKARKAASACLLFCGLSVMTTAYAAIERPRAITVSGEAKVQVEPDQIIITMAAINKEKTLEVAKQANDKTITSLISYFTDTLNIEPKYVQTDFLTVNPVYYQCSNHEEREGLCDPLEIQYFNLNKGIQVRLLDLSHYEAVVSQSLALGVNSISDIQFITTDIQKHKDKARKLATIAAKEKAQAIAETLEMTLAKPISINLNNNHWYYSGQRLGMSKNKIRYERGPGMNGVDTSSLAVGQINVTASVNIVFDMH